MLIGGISSKRFLKANYEELLIKNKYSQKKLKNLNYFIYKSAISIIFKIYKKILNLSN